MVLRRVGPALAWARHAGGHLLAVLWRWVSAPFRWRYRTILTPVGKAVAEIRAGAGRLFGRR